MKKREIVRRKFYFDRFAQLLTVQSRTNHLLLRTFLFHSESIQIDRIKSHRQMNETDICVH